MMDHTMTKNPDSIPYNIWPAEALRLAERGGGQPGADAVRTHAARGRGGVPAGQRRLSCQRALADPLRTWQQRRRRICRCASGTGRGAAGDAAGGGSDSPLPEEAQAAREAWLNAGGVIHAATIPWPDDISLIIDGLLGTGLRSAPRDPVAALIHQANHHPAPVVALDIPSGLNAQTGATPGAVVQADHTLTFIALKPGLLTGKARDVVGQLHHHALGLERWLAGQSTPLTRFCAAHLADWLPPRRATSHKGDHGKLVIVGGDRGTAGAIRMCGEAALRSGAGLVQYLTRRTWRPLSPCGRN